MRCLVTKITLVVLATSALILVSANGQSSHRGYGENLRKRDGGERQLQGTHTPVFLFAGQSNMEGHPLMAGCEYTKATETGKCIGEQPSVFPEFARNVSIGDIEGQNLDHIIDIVNNNLPYRQAMEKMTDHLLRIDPILREDHSAIAWWESANLLNLDATYSGFFDAIKEELDDVYCSWTLPNKNGKVELAEAKKLSASSGCGRPFGPELSFAHTLEAFDEFGIAKVAEGGTTLRHDWNMDERGRCWEVFERRMANIDGSHENCPLDGSGSCKWQGFVWFQGENDMFLDKEDVLAYGNELKKFIVQTRVEMMVNADPTFQKPGDIPVVIVQLGCWPGNGLMGQLIMEAEQDFVDQDFNAAIVRTDDLSCFYHYDVASHLVIGERIAKAMDSLLALDKPEDFDRATKDCQSGSALCYDDTYCCSSCNAYHHCRNS